MNYVPKNPLISVIGATGTGKSKLAVALARRFGGEIINADALQLYDGLPIVTNKIRVSEMCGVKHHLLGRLGLEEEPWTVSKFLPEALSIIENIKARGKLPILVGGTHYYVQSLLLREQTLMNNGEHNLTVAEEEERWPILKASEGEILDKLREVDPEMAAKWHPNESRRIRRSLVIWLQTGKTASEVYADQRIPRNDESLWNSDKLPHAGRESLLRYDSLTFCTYVNPETLDQRLADRVDDMLGEGLMEEVQLMRKRYEELLHGPVALDATRGIWVAIGYRQFLDYLAALDSGTATGQQLDALRQDAVEKTKIATRQYARSQAKWIKHKLLPPLVEAGGDDGVVVLDASSLSDWTEKIEAQALKLADDFLHARPLEQTTVMKQLLEQIMTEAKPYGAARLEKAVTCEICGVTMLSKDEFEKHPRTNRHKRALRKRRQDERLRRRSDEQMRSANRTVP